MSRALRSRTPAPVHGARGPRELDLLAQRVDALAGELAGAGLRQLTGAALDGFREPLPFVAALALLGRAEVG